MVTKFEKNFRFAIVCQDDISSAPKEFLLFKDGEGVAEWRDGRKVRFLMNAEAAAEVIKNFHSKGHDVQIDYEHQSVGGQFSRPSGDGLAPAAGWVHGFRYEAGAGLWVQSKWTPPAEGMLENREYRYFSPVFNIDPDTDRVSRVWSIALTNTPAMVALEPIVTSSNAGDPKQAPTGAKPMQQKVLDMLGIKPEDIAGKPEDQIWQLIYERMSSAMGQQHEQMNQMATAVGAPKFEVPKGFGSPHFVAAPIVAAAKAITDGKTAVETIVTAICSELGIESKDAKPETLVAKVKELKNVKPGEIDPTQFVAKAQHDVVITRLDAVETENKRLAGIVATGDMEKFIASGMAEGKIVAENKDHWGTLYKQNVQVATDLLKSAPKVGPVTTPVSGGQNGNVGVTTPPGDATSRTGIIASAKAEFDKDGFKTGNAKADWVNAALIEAGEAELNETEKKAV